MPEKGRRKIDMLPLWKTVKKKTVNDRGSIVMSEKVSLDKKVWAAQKYIQGDKSAITLGGMLGVNRVTIMRWAKTYQVKGENGQRRKHGIRYIKRNPAYLKSLKENAAKDYLSGKGSQKDICKKYKIRSRHALQNWIKVYHSHGELKGNTGGSYTTKARKTTEAERIEIALACITGGRNYGETAVKYAVSYQQVYTWVKKYEKLGEAGLEDRRGQRTAQQEPRTELERLRIENEKLKRQLYIAETEVNLLKKVKELERRDAWDK